MVVRFAGASVAWDADRTGAGPTGEQDLQHVLTALALNLVRVDALNCPRLDGGLNGWVYTTSLDCGCSR